MHIKSPPCRNLIGQARARLAPGDLFYGLTNVYEFINEILTNPEFQVFLQQTPPMQGLPKKGGYIRNLLDQIFSYLRDFVYGRDVSGDSLLTQGLDNVLALIQTPQTESGVQRAMGQMLGEPMAAMSPAGKRLNAEAAQVSNTQNASVPDTQNNEKRIPFLYKTGSDRANQSRGEESIGRLQELFKRPDDRRSESAIETGARRRSEFQRLRDEARRSGLEIVAPFFRRLANERTEINSGAEHTVYLNKQSAPNRVIKITHGDDIGDGSLGAKGGVSEYFEVLHLSNLVLGSDFQFEGLVDLGAALPQVVTSQTFIEGKHPTETEIAAELKRRGFTKKSKDSNLWGHKELGLDIYDAVPKNVIKDKGGVFHFIDVDLIPTRPVAEIIADLGGEAKVQAPMSPAGDLKKTVAKLTGKEIITTPSGGTYEKGGLLSTDGKLDKQAGDRWRKRGMRIGAQERMVNMAVQKLVAAVKGERKAGREVSMDLMNTALGNLDNPLTRPQRNEVEALRAEAKPKQREVIEKEANELEAAYMAKNREAFKVRQAQALAQLPADVAEAISEMTQHITALSSALKASGIVEPGLGATI